MIDIHSHILYDVDDGCKTLAESLELLKIAQKEGITHIICTPHYMHNGMYNKDYQETEELFNKFKQEVRESNIEIDLSLGNEIFIHPEIDELVKNKKVHTLANTNYVLVEFPMDIYRNEYDEYLYNLSILDYKIIIAHPERYLYVQENYKFCKRWLDEGYLIQINQNSIHDKVLSKVTKKLLKKGFINFIASDAHDMTRPCVLKDVIEDYDDNLNHISIL